MSIECGHAFLEEIASLSVAFALLQDPVLRTICGAWPHARPSATSRNDFEDLRIGYLQSLSMIIYFAPFFCADYSQADHTNLLPCVEHGPSCQEERLLMAVDRCVHFIVVTGIIDGKLSHSGDTSPYIYLGDRAKVESSNLQVIQIFSDAFVPFIQVRDAVCPKLFQRFAEGVFGVHSAILNCHMNTRKYSHTIDGLIMLLGSCNISEQIRICTEVKPGTSNSLSGTLALDADGLVVFDCSQTKQLDGRFVTNAFLTLKACGNNKGTANRKRGVSEWMASELSLSKYVQSSMELPHPVYEVIRPHSDILDVQTLEHLLSCIAYAMHDRSVYIDFVDESSCIDEKANKQGPGFIQAGQLPITCYSKSTELLTLSCQSWYCGENLVSTPVVNDVVAEAPRRWIEQTVDELPYRFGSFICSIGQFDRSAFMLTTKETKAMDPQQHHLLQCSFLSLSRYEKKGVSQYRDIGVHIGVCHNDHAVNRGDFSEYSTFTSTGSSSSIVAGRISYVFGMQGPAFVLDTACSSSLVALGMAKATIHSYDSTGAVLAGGSNVLLSYGTSILYSRSGMLARDCRCKTFDSSADGYGRGEAIATVLVGSHCTEGGIVWLNSVSVNQDGSSSSMTAPNGYAQETLLKGAWQQVDEVKHSMCIELHGTGTPLGDPIEVYAFGKAMLKTFEHKTTATLSASKSLVGHTEASAGILSVINRMLLMQQNRTPQFAHFKALSTHLRSLLNSTVHTCQIARQCISHCGEYCGVSSF